VTYTNTINPCGEIPLDSITPERQMSEPVYGIDADGVTHYWYPDRRPKSSTKGWSGCGQKNHSDFASFVYDIDGDVTCIGCLATEGDGEMQGLLNDLTRSMEAMKRQGVKLSPIEQGTMVHSALAQQYSQADVDAAMRVVTALGLHRARCCLRCSRRPQ
jgi:hypothetical protein